jgi:hypothetical protein
MLLWPGAARPDDGALELAVKATYLCKLPAFVAWPVSTAGTNDFVLCVVGRGPFGALLDNAAAGQTVQQRPIAIRRYQTITSNPGCELMFVAGSDAQSVASILAGVRGAPVLTVTDGQTDAAATGIVNFVLIDGHVRFEIDQRAALDNNLVISSKLLSLAARVRDRVVQ